MKKLLSICFILLFSFCSKKESQYPRIIVAEKSNIIEVNAKEMLGKYYCTPLVSGFNRDTVFNQKVVLHSNIKDYVFLKKYDTIFPRYNFKIIVDTSYTIPIKGFEYKSIDLPHKENMIENGLINGKEPTSEQIKIQNYEINKYWNKKFSMTNRYVTCFPLLILNNSKSIAYVKETRMIQEAKDIDGVWKPIEFHTPMPSCTPNEYFFKSKPKTYDGIAIIKYHGSFKTKLRVKVQINNQYYYSNEFEGSINHSQFSHSYLKKYIHFYKDDYEEGYNEKYEKYTLLQYNF